MKLQVFLLRLPAGSTKLRADVSTAFDIVAAFEKKVAAIKSDPALSPQGQRLAIAALREGGLSIHLKQLRDGIERELAGIKGERSKLVPPAPDKGDIAGELQRQEIRSWLRGLPMAERVKVALETDTQIIKDAVIHAPAALTGIAPEVHGEIIAKESERIHGARLAEFASHEKALAEAQAAVIVAGDDIGRASRVEGLAA